VIGAGIAGIVTAINLKQQGWAPIIFEKIHNHADVGASLLLYPNGMRALSRVGLAQKIVDNGCIILGVENKRSDGTLLSRSEHFKHYADTYGWPAVGVSRPKLLELLIDAAKEHQIPLHYDKNLTNIEDDVSKDYVTAYFKDGTHYRGVFIVGCDGVHSVARSLMFGPSRPSFVTSSYLIGTHRTEPDKNAPCFLTQVFGDKLCVVTYPCSDTRRMMGLMSTDPESEESWKALTAEQVAQFQNSSDFLKWAEPIPSLIKSAYQTIRLALCDRPPLGSWYKGRCVLVGDAAHPSSPHLGQGANQALVDCIVLGKKISEHVISNPSPPRSLASQLEVTFKEYQTVRIPRTTALVAGARDWAKVRLCEGEEACRKRDEFVANMYENVNESKIGAGLDGIFSVDLAQL